MPQPRIADERLRQSVAHPFTSPHEVLRNALHNGAGAAGLGEQVVGGEVVPDRWTVRGDTVDNLAGGQQGPCLPDHAVRELAALVRAIEAHFVGGPQDVEWSYGQGRFHLLQSRTITTLERRGEPS